MRVFAVLCVALCVFFSSPLMVFAEPPDNDANASRWYVSGSSIFALPYTSDTNQGEYDLDLGFGGVGAIGVQIPTSVVFTDFFYVELEGGFRVQDEEGGIAEVQTTTIHANLGMKDDLSSSVRLYVALGPGIAMHKIDLGNLSYKDTSFAFQTLLGLEFAMTDSFSSKLGYRVLATQNFEDQGFEATYLSHGPEFGFVYYF